MNTQNPNRRQVIKAAAWAMPVVALTVATPAAAASTPTPPDLYCTTGDTDVQDVAYRDGMLWITFAITARNSVDVTIRQVGEAEQHFNFVPQGTPTNGVAHMRNYSPGEIVPLALPRAYSIQRGDWMQVKTVHNENCVVIR